MITQLGTTAGEVLTMTSPLGIWLFVYNQTQTNIPDALPVDNSSLDWNNKIAMNEL